MNPIVRALENMRRTRKRLKTPFQNVIRSARLYLDFAETLIDASWEQHDAAIEEANARGVKRYNKKYGISAKTVKLARERLKMIGL